MALGEFTTDRRENAVHARLEGYLQPKDPNASRNCIWKFGPARAAKRRPLFAGDLFPYV
jgi:protein subunit release factor A